MPVATVVTKKGVNMNTAAYENNLIAKAHIRAAKRFSLDLSHFSWVADANNVVSKIRFKNDSDNEQRKTLHTVRIGKGQYQHIIK